MSFLTFLVIPLLVYAVSTGLGVSIILWLSKKRFPGDMFAACLIPICFWFVLVLIIDKGKTLSNLVFEPFIMAVLLCVLAVVHCVMDGREFLSKRSLGIMTVGFSIVIALVVYLLTPALPE